MSRASAPAAASGGAAASSAAASAAAASSAAFRLAMSGGDEEEGTTWMQPMTRSWEEIAEDSEGGGLTAGGGQLAAQRERKARLRAASLAQGGGQGAVRSVIEKGVIRFLFVVLDFSWGSGQNDLKVTLDLMEQFIREYFDQNPLSQLGLIVAANKLSVRVTDLSGNPEAQIRAMRECAEQGGEFGMQNALEMAREKLNQIPPYGSREILLVLSSLSTVDPGDLHETIAACHSSHISCSVISLAAEMFVATMLATTTGGSCSVALNRDHYKSLLLSHIPPLPAHKASAKQKQARKWIHMGFPEQRYETYPSLCSCHSELRYGGYQCPKCHSKLCELPSECGVCGLTLVSSPHLARSFHHLFPVPDFDVEGETTDGPRADGHAGAGAGAAAAAADFSVAAAALSSPPAPVACRSCCRLLPSSSQLRLRCPACRWTFCIECDEYIHTVLHNCPGCLSAHGQSHNQSSSANSIADAAGRDSDAADGPQRQQQSNSAKMEST